MDVSKKEELSGPELIEELIKLTGLPPLWVHAEIIKILNTKDLNTSELSLEELRGAVLGYLECLEAGKNSESDKNLISPDASLS